MASQSQVTNNQTWSESLNPQLTRRLLRPVVSPGVIGTQVAGSIISRVQGMTNQLPLMTKLIQRQHRLQGQSAEAVPIVYAQPIRPAAEPVEMGHVTSPNVASRTKGTGQELPLKSTIFQVDQEASVQKSTGSNTQKYRENSTPETSNLIPSKTGKSGTKPLIVQAKFVNSTKKTSPRADSDSKPPVYGLEPSRKTRLSSELSWPVVKAKPIDFQSSSSSGSSSQTMLVNLPNPPNPEAKGVTQNSFPARRGVGGEVNSDNLKNNLKNTNTTLPTESKLSLGSSGNLTQSPVIQGSPKRSLIKEIVSPQSQGNQPLIQKSPKRSLIKEIVSPQSQGNQPLIQRTPEQPVVREMLRKDGYQISAPLVFSASRVNRTSFSGNGLGVSSSPSIADHGSGVIQRMPSVNGASVSTPVSTTSLQANTVIQKASENTSGATTNNQSVEHIDVDELVEKVHHKLMQNLTIESERRGLTQWH